MNFNQPLLFKIKLQEQEQLDGRTQQIKLMFNFMNIRNRPKLIAHDGSEINSFVNKCQKN